MHELAPLNLQWLVFRIGAIDFLYCWVANSIWLECAELLIIAFMVAYLACLQISEQCLM